MAEHLKMTSTTVNQNGSIDMEFTWNGEPYNWHFASITELEEWATHPCIDVAGCARMIAGFWYSKQPDFSSTVGVLNKVLHVHPEADPASIISLGPNPSLCWTRGLLT